MKKFMFLLALFTFAGVQVFAQQTVTGTVTGADDGAAMPGVNVSVKGTTVGTMTGEKGVYSINVPTGSTTLVFSFVGMQTQEVAITGSVVNCAMKTEENVIEDVVVTALGISREKKSLGYAAQEVSGDNVNKSSSSSFVNALSGKVAGMQIRDNGNMGGSTNVVIRGNRSLTGDNQALFVVDGVPINNTNSNSKQQKRGNTGYDYGSPVSDIDPSNIESMTTLKGSAATALYGSRAANGVILITTKKGSQNKKGIGIDVKTGMSIGKFDKTTFPKYQDKYGAGYGQYYEDESGFFWSRDIQGNGTMSLVTPMTEDASYGAAYNPNTMVYQWDAFVPESPNFNKATPWQYAANGPSTFFQTSKIYKSSVDLSGGTDKSSFRFSYTNYDETGILPNSSLKRNNFSLTGKYDLTSKLSISSSANFINTQGKGRNSTGYNDNIMSSFRQWWELNVDVQELKNLFNATNRNVTWNRSEVNDATPIYWDNYYWTRYKNFETDQRNRLFGNVQIDYKINDVFNFMARGSVDTYSSLNEERRAVGSVPAPFGVSDPPGDISSGYQRTDGSFTEANYDAMFRGNKTYGDLNINGLIGVNIRRSLLRSSQAATNGGLSIADLYSLSNSVSALQSPIETQETKAVNGYFGSLSLGYKNFLYIDATARQDISSTLPDGKNKYFYPSATLSFVFSQMAHLDWMSLGKLRFNYAQIGNDAPFGAYTDIYTINSPFGSTAQISVPNIKNNPDLKSEKTKSNEIGLEMQFFKNRAGFDLAYYDNKSFDQIMPVSVSTATGYSQKYVNSGEIENKGIELALNVTPVKFADFSWTLNFNWAKNTSKVVSLYEGVDNLVLGTFGGGVTLNATKGQPYGTLEGTDFVYLNGQRVVKTNGRYQITGTSNNVIGNINPDWTGGVTNTFTYKNFAFSFLIDMQHGGDVFSLDMYYGLATGLYPETAGNNDLGNPLRNLTNAAGGGGVIMNGVQADGTVNTVRVSAVNYGTQGYRYNPNSRFVYDASYIKLRELSLTYNIPAKSLAKSFLTGANFSLVGSNLWIIKKNLPYADPESGLSSGNLQGYQCGVLPTTKIMGFNIELKF
jgi:TonB-linked SusC/RagA family outer membrane protein